MAGASSKQKGLIKSLVENNNIIIVFSLTLGNVLKLLLYVKVCTLYARERVVRIVAIFELNLFQ